MKRLTEVICMSKWPQEKRASYLEHQEQQLVCKMLKISLDFSLLIISLHSSSLHSHFLNGITTNEFKFETIFTKTKITIFFWVVNAGGGPGGCIWSVGRSSGRVGGWGGAASVGQPGGSQSLGPSTTTILLLSVSRDRGSQPHHSRQPAIGVADRRGWG